MKLYWLGREMSPEEVETVEIQFPGCEGDSACLQAEIDASEDARLGSWRLEEEGAADALLIAAAPDLLQLLQAAVARIELEIQEGGSILSAWLPDARAAIAKATGSAS